MPTRKQRRRRAKDRRHEWEYVYVDDEGREVEVDEEDAPTAKPPKPAAKGSGRPTGRAASRADPKVGPGRKVDPPSWRRVFRRAAIFAPLMLIVIYLLKPKDSGAAVVLVQMAVLLAFFLPFSYFLDGMMYRSYRKRIGDPIPPRERKPRSR
jgi:hypothetical protein